MKIKRNINPRAVRNSIIFNTCCILLGILMFYPVLWMFLGSFKTQQEIFSFDLLPKEWVLTNFVEGWKGFGNYSFGTFFWNSIVISTLSTLGTLFTAAWVGYGFARTRFHGKSILFACMLITMMLPYQIIMIPQYIIFKNLNWINTFLPIIIPWALGYPFFIFLMVQFMRTVPVELDESAYIDGCNKFSIFFRIYLPLTKSALLTVAIFSFYWKWNDFLQPLIYLSKTGLYTVSVALQMFADPTSVSNWGALFSMASLSVLPIFIIFFLLQRYITEGIATTGLKG
jgi:multiple sugar transport system permease protein